MQKKLPLLRAHRRARAVVAMACLGIFLSSVAFFSESGFAQQKKPEAKAPEKKEEVKKPETPPIYKVKEAPFELKVDLEGVVESKTMTPIAVEPKAWADLTVVEAVPHGAKVKKGDVLIRFEDEKLKEAIATQKADQPLAKLTLETADAELALLEKTTPLTLDAARTAKLHAEEGLAYFEDVTLPNSIESTKRGLKRYEESLEYAQEELNQLKKMYEADDLTEETEEIILKRAQRGVESAEWSLKLGQERTARTLSTTIPRDHDARKKALEKTQVEWRASEKTTRDALEKKRLEVEKAHRDAKKAAEKFAEMQADLEVLTVLAPHDGIVYYGAEARGKWVTGVVVAKKMVPGGKVLPKEIFMTVVDADKQQIRASVPEAKLKNLEPGLAGTAHPTWDADLKFDTKLESIGYIPLPDKTFDAVFSSSKKGGDKVFPGMGAKISIELYKKDKAIAIPKKAVKKEGNKHFVTMKDGKKREVKIGKSSASQTEITSGLKVGEEIKTQ